jgi:hypothetical protein
MRQVASLSNKKIGVDAIFLSTQSTTSNPQAGVTRRIYWQYCRTIAGFPGFLPASPTPAPRLRAPQLCLITCFDFSQLTRLNSQTGAWIEQGAMGI